MNKELNIRKAKASDALFLTSISFVSKRYWKYPESYYKIWQDELTITEEYIESNTIFVAEKNNTIIAYCSIKKDEETGYWLDHLFVRPAYIGSGIGSELVGEVIKFCKSSHIKSIKLLSDPNAKGFYEKLGAKYIKEVESNIPERQVSLYVLPVQTNKKIEEAVQRKKNNEPQKSTNKGMKLNKGGIEKKLYELDKDLDEEEREEYEKEASIADFKFSTPIGYKFQCEEEAESADDEIAVTEEASAYELSEEAGTDSGEEEQRQGIQQEVEEILHRVTEEEKIQRKKVKQQNPDQGKGEVTEETDIPSIKTEKEKMLLGEEYIAWGNEIADDRRHAEKLLREFSLTDTEDRKQIHAILKELLGSSGEYLQIESGFKCQYGYNIHVGENLCIGYNCVILDQAKVSIGDNCIISPQVGIYTAAYPINAERRMAGYEYAKPITIGNNVWIGGGSIIKPGVTIGDNAVIEPGSVVSFDIKADMIAGGNPAKVIKEIVK